jgi:putative hydrolase of the HAD superfamily
VRLYQNIAFDLDDTLLDTSGALIPAAARRAVSALLAAKYDFNESQNVPSNEVEFLLKQRSSLLKTDPRSDIWLSLAHQALSLISTSPSPHPRSIDTVLLAQVARDAFFKHPLETLPDEAIRLTSGAREILEWSHSRANIHLVTSGDATTQNKKIDRLGIRDFFTSVQCVEARASAKDGIGAKQVAFQSIANTYENDTLPPLSIGNRVDTDLGEAKLIGWKTAWIRHGEHAALVPQKPWEIPDFEVSSPAELLSLWKQQFSDQDLPQR